MENNLTYQRLQEVLYLRRDETLFRRRIASDGEDKDQIAGDVFSDVPGEEIRLIMIDGDIYSDTPLKIMWNTGRWPCEHNNRVMRPKRSTEKLLRSRDKVIGVRWLKKWGFWRAVRFKNRHLAIKEQAIYESTSFDEAVLARLSYDICMGIVRKANPRSAYRHAVDQLGLKVKIL